ncbi:GTPase ObgE [Clostridium sp. MB40-C1]|uniref:GTPase ObgE n=1 Tax=Clostridium sp. MB40-C1 TaxID=3070996 RepID=UPI0027DF37FD|nr:GTPase ObgE [Clostridium sp. MB40-C1]WMJ82340.1 GTPase ObgE [Clostridium sp. MB40-C1]
MFIDIAKIFVKSGNGGNGCVSYRREKYIPLGGPDGGDGGSGGNVILQADRNLTTLLDFKYRKKYDAENGKDGLASKCSGRKAEDLVIKIPMGTIIKDMETGKIMADLSHEGDTYVVVRGGRGGRGNYHFATPTRRTPNFAEPGMPGEERWITLELKLLADVGLLGYPNVGKSTLLSMVSKAKPKIANYHFTTLKPNLGVIKPEGAPAFVMADIPGIIEGASEGVGLGLDFLRHIERTRLLIHVVDISGVEGRDPVEDFIKINEELKNYNVKLWDRPQIVAANKSDMLYDDEVFERFKNELNKIGFNKIFKISAATREGVDDLMKEAARVLSTIPVKDLEIDEAEKFIEEEKKFTYEINVEDNIYSINGSFVDRLLRSVNLDDPDSMRYLQKVLKDKRIIEELRKLGIEDGDIVKLEDFEFEFLL